MNRGRDKGKGGFTLLEVLVTIGLTSVVLGLGTMAFSEVIRLRGAQERYNQRMAASDLLLRRVARDVRQGRAFLATGGGFASGANTLVLSSGPATVVYRAVPGKTERIELPLDSKAHDGRKGGVERGAALDAPGVRVSFDFEGAPAAKARAVVITAEWDERPEIGVSHPVLSLRVALRNRERGAQALP